MEQKSVFAGNLSFIGLADIFQILGGNSSSGILKITSQYAPSPGQIYFKNGDPINAICNEKRGIEAIYALFGWTDGKFDFLEEEVNIDRVVKQGRMEIVLDALRMLDDGMLKKVGPPSFDKALGKEKGQALPVLKGPFPDYTYIVNEEDFKAGDKIVKEGRYGKWIWVILEGVAEVTRAKAGGPMTICRLGTGCFIGTFTSLIYEEYARNSTVMAAEDLWVGLIDTERLAREYTLTSPDFRRFLLSLDRRFKKITDRAVEICVEPRTAFEVSKEKKEVIKKGSATEDLFMISEGNADVVTRTEKGDFPLVSLEKEDFFGKVPFFDMGHEPMGAGVLGSADLKTEKIDTDGFQREYEKLSNTFRNLIFNASNGIAVTTRLVYNLLGSKGKSSGK
ncbi:MAG: DUF4388 domain-containing protein [Deltaproteobacteria bacterium]|nr:DUF4388 domain-containing protein [Deltaproteobacteria bacterium]